MEFIPSMGIVKHFSFRRYSKNTLLKIVEVVADNENMKNRAGLGFRELKWKTEQALNQTLHPKTFHSYLDILIGAKKLTKYKQRTKGSKAEYRLTKQARQEHKAGVLHIDSIKSAKYEDLFADEKERFRLYNLLFKIATIKPPFHKEIYDTEGGLLETICTSSSLQISAGDLIPMRVGIEEVNCVVTYYKPISCIEITKRDYYPDSLSRDNAFLIARHDVVAASDATVPKGVRICHQQNKYNEKNPTYYYVKLTGFSISDVLAHNHNSYAPFHEDLTRAKIKEGVKLLVKEAKILKRIGRFRGETRYDFADDLLRLIVGECLSVFKSTLEALSLVWDYERKVNTEERAWLEQIYGHKRADRRISDYYDSLKSNRETGTIDWQEHEDEMKICYKWIIKHAQDIKEGYYRDINNYRENSNEATTNSLIERYPFPLQFMIDEMICPPFLEKSLGIKKAKRVPAWD